jgi:hypothetical protein
MGRDSTREPPPGRRRSRSRRVVFPARRAGGARQGAGGRDGGRDLGRGAERRRDRARRSGRREHELVRRVRRDDGLRLPHGGAERGQRHDGRRRDRTAPRPRDGCRLPLPPGRVERVRHDPRRGCTLPDAGAARGRDGASVCDRAVVGLRRRDSRPQRAVDRLVDRVRHLDEVRLTHGHPLRGSGRERGRRVSAPRAAPRGRRVPLPGRGRERARHRPRRRPVLPHGSGPGRVDGRRRRCHDLLRAAERDRRPAEPRQRRVVRVRHERGAREPHA